MVTTGVHEKDANSLSDFDIFSLVQVAKFSLKIWSLLLTDTVKNFSLDMILVSTSKNLMKATFSEGIVLYQHNERYQ